MELSDMLTRSYLQASYGFIMLFTFPFGPTYFIPGIEKIYDTLKQYALIKKTI